MYINTNLDNDRAEKLTRIQQQTNEDIAQIIGHALDLYYQQLRTQVKNHQPHEKTPLEMFEELGLVGCIKDGDPNLSTNYKSIVHQAIEEKHRREQEYEPE